MVPPSTATREISVSIKTATQAVENGGLILWFASEERESVQDWRKKRNNLEEDTLRDWTVGLETLIRLPEIIHR